MMLIRINHLIYKAYIHIFHKIIDRMTTYKKIPEKDPEQYEAISKELKNFSQKIKNYQKSKKNKQAEYENLQKIENTIKKLLSISKSKISNKSKLETLEIQFKDLSSKLSKLEPGIELECESDSHNENKIIDDEISKNIVEADHLAFQDSSELKEGKYTQKKKMLEELNKDMQSLNEMFKDTSKLINQDGEDLKRIENKITQAEDNTQKGAEELLKASKYQNSARKKVCWIFLITLISFALISALVAVIILNR